MADRNKNLVQQYDPDDENQQPEIESVEGEGTEDSQPQSPLTSSPLPERGGKGQPSPGQGGDKGAGPKGNAKPVDTAGVPAAPLDPNATQPEAPEGGSTPRPVDTGAVGEPLPETPEPEKDDDSGNRPDKPDADKDRDDESPDEEQGGENPESENETAGSEGGVEEGAGEEAGAAEEGGAMAEGAGAAEGAAVGVEAAEGAAAAAGTAEAGAAAAATSEIWGPVAIVIGVAVLVIAIIVGLVLAATAASKQGSGTDSAPKTGQQAGGKVSGSVQELAKQILSDKNITVQPNPAGSLNAAAAGKCSPTGNGNCVMLDKRVLQVILEMGKQFPITITSLTTGTHTGCSNHYEGRAVDLGTNSHNAEIEAIAKKAGATEIGGAVPNPNISDGNDHIHIGWDGPHTHC